MHSGAVSGPYRESRRPGTEPLGGLIEVSSLGKLICASRLMLGLAVAAVLAASPAFGQTPRPGAVPPVGPADTSTRMSGEALMGVGNLGEDWFLNLSIGTVISFDKVMLGLQAPLRIRIVDSDPEQDEWYRTEDWDETSDWTRIVRFVQYGRERDPFYARLGELVAASIGHGTIVSRYYNTLDIDHYYTGLSTKVNLEEGGAELLTNNVLAWNLVAVRGYVRPFLLGMEDPSPFLAKIVTGTTFAADFRAPWEIRMEQSASGAVPQVDGSNNLLFDSRTAWLWGIDTELQLVRTEVVAVTPYMDLNLFAGTSAGFHLGVLNELLALSSEFSLKLEYRFCGARYAPAYFNTLYDIERLSFLPVASMDPDVPAPKYRYFRDGEDLESRHGMYGELYANVLGLLGLGGAYEDYQGPDNAAVMLRADLPEIAGIKLTSYYARRNFDDFDDMFSLDHAYLVNEARVSMSGPLFLYAMYTLYWELAQDTDEPGMAEYETTESWGFGAGAAFSF